MILTESINRVLDAFVRITEFVGQDAVKEEDIRPKEEGDDSPVTQIPRCELVGWMTIRMTGAILFLWRGTSVIRFASPARGRVVVCVVTVACPGSSNA